MASDIWLRTILIVRKETRCRHIGYSFRLTARVLLYAPSHIQDSTYHGLCYTSRGALAGTRNSSMGPPPKKPNTHRGTATRDLSAPSHRQNTSPTYAAFITQEIAQWIRRPTVLWADALPTNELRPAPWMGESVLFNIWISVSEH